jgi:hypothetical protein
MMYDDYMSDDEYNSIYGPMQETDYSNVYGGNNYTNIGQDYLGDNLNPQPYAPGSFEPVQDFGQGYYGESAFTDPYVSDEGGGLMSMLGRAGSGAMNFLGENGRGLLSTTLGGLGMYGNYQAGKERSDLDRDIANANREIAQGSLDLQRDQFGLNQGIDDMASKALGMQLLVNRGRMSSDQVNPWLNFMYSGRQGMFKNDPELSGTFASSPYAGTPLGIAASQPTEGQFYRDPMQQGISGQTNNMRFAEGGAVPRMGMRQRLNEMYAQRRQPMKQIGAPGLMMTPGVQSPMAPPRSFDDVTDRLSGMFGGMQAGMQAPVAPPPQRTLSGLGGLGISKMMNPAMMGGVGVGATAMSPQNMDAMRGAIMKGGLGAGALGRFGDVMINRSKQLPNVPAQSSMQMKRGGLGAVKGSTGGQDDKVNASLSDGEYVFDADTVSSLGDGNTEAGAKKLDTMREEIRRHKRSASPKKIPPKAKDPMSYVGRK